MKERPILFSGEMVRAILEGRKTQTRRIVKPQPIWIADPGVPFKTADANPKGIINCPYGKKGDRLWVRETWQNFEEEADDGSSDIYNNFVYYADDQDQSIKWKPSIHMPKEAARIWLKVDEVRVERLQDISDFDCEAEGIKPAFDGNAKDWRENENGWHRTFRQLWDRINLKRGYSWDRNPWVWVIKFHRIRGSEK